MRSARGILFLTTATLVAIVTLAIYRSVRAATLIVPDGYPTIQAAIDAAGPGDTILVRPGTYFENVTLDKPVVLTAESFDVNDPTRNTTLIDGGSSGLVDTLTIPPGVSPMPTVRGFVIRNGRDGIVSRSEFVAEYNYFSQSLDQIDYSHTGGGINRHNVYFNAGDDALDLDNTKRSLLIEGNRMMYSLDDGIEIRLQSTSAPAQPITITIRNNEFVGSGEDGIQFIDYIGLPEDTNRRFVISGNLIANSVKAGIGLMPNAISNEDYSGADTVEAIRVYNNTLYGNDYGISGGDNLVAFNNLIAHSTTRGVWKVQGRFGANSVVAYTLFYNNGTQTEQSTLGAGNLFGQDPFFAAPPNPGPDGVWRTVDDDFSGMALQAGSPAIDAGVTQYIARDRKAIPPTAISGFTGPAPDLGWQEFMTPATATTGPSPTPRPIRPRRR